MSEQERDAFTLALESDHEAKWRRFFQWKAQQEADEMATEYVAQVEVTTTGDLWSGTSEYREW